MKTTKNEMKSTPNVNHILKRCSECKETFAKSYFEYEKEERFAFIDMKDPRPSRLKYTITSHTQIICVNCADAKGVH